MTRYRMKKQIKEYPDDRPADVNIPKCPIHDTHMKFSVEDFAWACQNTGCRQIAYPEAEIGRGKVIMGSGPITLIIYHQTDGTDHYMLRCMENNVIINITDLVQTISVNGKAGPLPEVAVITMQCAEIAEIEDNAK